MTKTGCYFCTAVDARESLIFFVTTQLQCFFNNWCEIFFLVDMNSTRESHHFCCKHSVSIAVFGGHQTVGGVEDRGLEDDQILFVDSAMQFRNFPLSERISLRVDRHGQEAFHHVYRC